MMEPWKPWRPCPDVRIHLQYLTAMVRWYDQPWGRIGQKVVVDVDIAFLSCFDLTFHAQEPFSGLPFGKRLHSYWKSTCFTIWKGKTMEKSSRNLLFSIAMSNCQRLSERPFSNIPLSMVDLSIVFCKRLRVTPIKSHYTIKKPS